jgi:hypothetical protein
MQAQCSSRNILGPVVKEARKKIYNCAFLGHLPLILDVNVGAGSRPNLTARAVPTEIPEARVASVAMNTLLVCETYSLFARPSLTPSLTDKGSVANRLVSRRKPGNRLAPRDLKPAP